MTAGFRGIHAFLEFGPLGFQEVDAGPQVRPLTAPSGEILLQPLAGIFGHNGYASSRYRNCAIDKICNLYIITLRRTKRDLGERCHKLGKWPACCGTRINPIPMSIATRKLLSASILLKKRRRPRSNGYAPSPGQAASNRRWPMNSPLAIPPGQANSPPPVWVTNWFSMSNLDILSKILIKPVRGSRW